MSPVWKYLLGLALVLPVGGYVAGSLAATDDDPAPREVIVMEDAPGRSTVPGTTLSPRPAPSASSAPDGDDSGNGDDNDSDVRGDDGDDDVPVVPPRPDDLDDEDEPDEDEPDEDEGGGGED